jgi:hypothetical protein
MPLFGWNDREAAARYMKAELAEKAWYAMEWALRVKQDFPEHGIEKTHRIAEAKFHDSLYDEAGCEWWRYESGDIVLADETCERLAGASHGAKFHLAMWSYLLLYGGTNEEIKREHERFRCSLKHGGRYDHELRDAGLLPEGL